MHNLEKMLRRDETILRFYANRFLIEMTIFSNVVFKTCKNASIFGISDVPFILYKKC